MSSSSEHEAESSQDSTVVRVPKGKKTPKSSAGSSEDRLFPLAAVLRVAQSNLEKGTLIAKDAKEALNKIAGNFVYKFACDVYECTKRHKRSTIKPEDILEAAESIDVPGFYDKLKEYSESAKDKSDEKPARKSSGGAKKSKKEESEVSDDAVSSDGE